MILAFPLGGGSVSARRYAHEKSTSHCSVRPDRHGISGPGNLSRLLRWPYLSGRSAVSRFAAEQLALLTNRRAA